MSHLTLAFINPPHADWSLANNMTYLLCQSHYNKIGKYKNNITWLPALYKWNLYQSYEEIYEEIKEADIFLFSSYVWNYPIIDAIAKIIKDKDSSKITVIGGPHIGIHEPKLLKLRQTLYNYICQPTKPGEPFVSDLIDSWFENKGIPNKKDIAWEVTSSKKMSHTLESDISVYEEHTDYLKNILQYARKYDLEPFTVLETTRGCPFKCVFCEWGGGINTKIIKKPLDIVKKDITVLRDIGFNEAFLTDANFGTFEDRDLSIFEFAWNNDFSLTDISSFKSKNLERKKRFIDSWIQIIKSREKDSLNPVSFKSSDSWNPDYVDIAGGNVYTEGSDVPYVAILPTISMQSISDEAMRIAQRIDLRSEDKIELAYYLQKRLKEEELPLPQTHTSLELILAMPGSTLDDFYKESEIIFNFQAWSSFRHDYMFLPDSNLSDTNYQTKYDIETVEVFVDISDEDGVEDVGTLYQNQKSYFKTIRSCYSFTVEEMYEMWFMNLANSYLLENIYLPIKNYMNISDFMKLCYSIISQLDEFKLIQDEIIDIFNPSTAPRSIRKLQGQFRTIAVVKLLENNKLIINSEILQIALRDKVA
tara:strand:+ start:1460 stop:3229 length:1770 start_codon:yes stop_codon:yes gene_type:complete